MRKLLTSGQAALINFVSPTYKDMWRFTLVAKDSELTSKGVRETATHPKRYTFPVESERTNKTLAERMEWLSLASNKTMETLVEAFSVEKMSKDFFDEYKEHYQNFVQYLTGKRMVWKGSKWQEKEVSQPSAFLKSIFNGNEKEARDFCKKLLGRIVFLYFVQKKRWLGASDKTYKDGSPNFVFDIFKETGSDENFFCQGLTELFFNALNKERPNDLYETPEGRKVRIPYLNGGLFTRDEVDELLHKKGDAMTFPAPLFSNKDKEEIPLPKNASVKTDDAYEYRGFLDFLNAFNFTVYEDSPDDHTVAVDPEMLGHIFENLLEDNKDKGAYYTPKEIVNYMCRESLLEYLNTHLGDKTDKEELGQLVREKDSGKLSTEVLKAVSEKLDEVKICDPAIGSGAFPMGLLQEIFSIKESIAYRTGSAWNPAKVKEDIIQNAIYGVDIEKGAVDIARLRFWLALVVDRDKPKALPNLDYKIVVGNSLIPKFNGETIEIDWERKLSHGAGQKHLTNLQKTLTEVSDKQKKIFDPKLKNKKKTIKKIRNLKLQAMISQVSFNKERYLNSTEKKGGFDPLPSDIKYNTERNLKIKHYTNLIQKLNSIKQNESTNFEHFDWKLDFPEILNEALAGESKGFDIVIGNPPYVQLQKMGKAADDLSNNGYETYTRTGDIYCLFYEKGYQLLKPKGILTFITSNKWMRAAYGEVLRKYFIDHSNPLILIDFGGYRIFKSATVDTNILIGKKAPFKNKVRTCVLQKEVSLSNMSDYFRQQSTVSSSFSSTGSWVILSEIEHRIKEKVEALGTPLKEWDIKINYGIKTGLNEAFIISSEKRNELIKKCPKADSIIQPILRGKDIQKYNADWNGLYVIASHNGYLNEEKEQVPAIDINDYPAVKAHLNNFWDKLNTRQDKGVTPYNLRSCIYMEDFFRPKIVWKRIGSVLRFSYDESQSYCLDSTCFLTGTDLKYLVGFLNSSICRKDLLDNAPKTGTGDVITSVQALEPVKIPDASPDQKQNISNLVDRAIAILSSNQSVNIYDIEYEIDEVIFDVLSLTEPEKNFLRSLNS
ncbi:MAG: Eco57I restriction-modification methylase domain-containing protein [Ekhidna sp.]|nr:Eco57I restriction-modification methylase domain-containing protein [Ekhidna sp.]